MHIPGAPYDDILVEHLEAARSVLPADTPWIDAHTHTGFNDPDGVKGSVEEILAGLDRPADGPLWGKAARAVPELRHD